MIELNQTLCTDLAVSGQREWLVTNGIGGFAMGAVAGVLTRRYHGLLIAALKPPLGRTLLATRLDETATYGNLTYALGAVRRAGGVVEPTGYRFLERFHLDHGLPVWHYALGDALLEKRIWMRHGENTTYVRYRLVRGTEPLQLTLAAWLNARDYHRWTRAGELDLRCEAAPGGLAVRVHGGELTYGLFCPGATVTLRNRWVTDGELAVERRRGYEPRDDNLHAADLAVSLEPGTATTCVISTVAAPLLNGEAALAEAHARAAGLLERARAVAPPAAWTPAARQLVLAADQFLVRRPTPADPDGVTVIAGYPWFGDWGRDTMISLPGLALATGRFAEAAGLIRTFARFVDQGLLPNRFPDVGEEPEYNTADATLWYFEAIRACHAATGDDALLAELFPVLREIVAWHRRGTRFGIGVDPADGLLRAGAEGLQLTWMDAKYGDWVITPRRGKPVELSALWFNALHCMATFARRLGEPAQEYLGAAAQTQAGFARFWHTELGYCYDVLDGPEGDDPSLRPNQILAVALPFSPLPAERQRAVVDVCARRLLTPVGLRSLDPAHRDYAATYAGSLLKRDLAYHQGTVWAWLLGPFISAHLRVYGDRDLAFSYLRPLLDQLAAAGLGSLSEVFDGDAPYSPDGCPAQAWSVAEALRALYNVS